MKVNGAGDGLALTGIQQRGQQEELSARKDNSTSGGTVTEVQLSPYRGKDSVSLSSAAPQRTSDTYTMSDIKKAVQERIARAGSPDEAPEAIADAYLGADREETIEIARLRMKTGFYSRPDVIDAMVTRILERM